MTDLAHPAVHPFFVDGKRFTTDKQNLTGQEIKTIAGVAGNYQLYLEEQDNAPDRAISDGETVQIDHPEKHFFAVPPATFGKK